MRDLLPQHLDVGWTIIYTTPFFLMLFVFLIYWTFKRGRKSIYEITEKLPLEDLVQEKYDTKR
jgi:cbb3-type cytochrome oxidase subunit 3